MGGEQEGGGAVPTQTGITVAHANLRLLLHLIGLVGSVICAGMLDELLWVKGLACVPQRADLLRLRARALAAIAAAAGQAGKGRGRAEQLAAHLSQQAGRLAAAIYALSLGPEHPMSRGAGRAAEGSASSTTTTARREGRSE